MGLGIQEVALMHSAMHACSRQSFSAKVQRSDDLCIRIQRPDTPQHDCGEQVDKHQGRATENALVDRLEEFGVIIPNRIICPLLLIGRVPFQITV